MNLNDATRQRVQVALREAGASLNPDDLRELEAAVGEPLEPGSLALGVLVAGFVFRGVNPIQAALLAPEELREFLAQARTAAERDPA